MSKKYNVDEVVFYKKADGAIWQGRIIFWHRTETGYEYCFHNYKEWVAEMCVGYDKHIVYETCKTKEESLDEFYTKEYFSDSDEDK